ncbi:MAG TPA: molybdopterin-dependent oxidoreductase [Acidobacteriota bacterium]|jgi:DMSO/TMAO reductase YedYZ molybdopterin-dependent catalytic subunit|nr:molybdopterin-dependent oxidoreductase [Acidobacteriota bacterium]
MKPLDSRHRVRRREFLAAAAVALNPFQRERPKLLVPTDQPDEFGFRIMWYNPIPPIDQAKYRLRVGGLVERAQSISLQQLRRFPQATQNSRMKCVQCWSSRATWGGFHFGDLMEAVRPLKKAKAIRIDCADKWYEYMSLEEMLAPRVLLVLDLAGKPLPDRHGAPLRLIAPAKYGYKSAKLITSIEFVAEGRGSMACDIGPYYTPDGNIQPGYDQPLDLGPGARRKIRGGEIMEY